MAHGELTHFDIPADDLGRATRFYADLFGWDIAVTPQFPDYGLFESGPGDTGGGLGIRGVTAPDRPRMYFLVDSIDAALPKVQALGGTVVVDKEEVPGHGWYAAITDSEGNEIGLWEGLAG